MCGISPFVFEAKIKKETQMARLSSSCFGMESRIGKEDALAWEGTFFFVGDKCFQPPRSRGSRPVEGNLFIKCMYEVRSIYMSFERRTVERQKRIMNFSGPATSKVRRPRDERTVIKNRYKVVEIYAARCWSDESKIVMIYHACTRSKTNNRKAGEEITS